MKRKLAAIGAIVTFIAAGFVTPNDDNFHVMGAMAREQMRVRSVDAVLGGHSLTPAQATHAVKVLKAATEDPAVSALLSKTVRGATAANLHEAVTILHSVSEPAKIRTVAKGVIRSLKTHTFSQHWKKYRQSTDAFTRAQMERVEWAEKKQDVRLCSPVADAAAKEVGSGGLSGDYLAFCVAVVMSEPLRCDQVAALSLAPIRSLCFDELAPS